MNKARVLAAVALATTALPSVAHADIAYSQVNPNAYGIKWTRTGGTASIADIATPGYSDLLVNLTLGDGSVVQALFNLTGSTSTAAFQTGVTYEQDGISGTFSFTDATTNANYLTGTYTDAVITGSGKAGSFFSADSGNVTYVSGSEASSSTGDFSISLNNTSKNFSASPGQPLNSFSAHTTGTYSQQAVPELSTWAMMLLGFGILGAVARRRGFRLPERMRSPRLA